MPIRKLTTVAALIALVLAASASALAASATPSVTVRVEGKTATVLTATATQTQSAAIRRGGAPAGACPGSSAMGALAVATRGTWVGRYRPRRGGYKIKSIIGAHARRWELFVNEVAQTKAACQVALSSGDNVLFAAVPASGAPQYPLLVSAPATTTAGSTFHVTVTGYNAAGKGHPLAAATVSVNGASGPTNASGVVPLTPNHPGTYTIIATKAGYIRDEVVVTVK